MKIRNQQDIEALQAALNRCSRTVWLIGPGGEQYDLKSERDLHQGIDRLAADGSEAMELFTSDDTDEMVMMEFYSRHIA